MNKVTLIILSSLFTGIICSGQIYQPNWASLNTRKIPEWFHNDKFGIFIHWGTYAVPAYAPVIPNSGDSYSEWYWKRLIEGKKDFKAFHDKNYGSSLKYTDFEKSFKAEMFDPVHWANVFKKSGAKYVVLTAKHHEGYCLWNSGDADRTWGHPWNSVTGTPKRDLLGDLTNAVRDAGLKMGYYYSLYEWFNPLWLSNKKRYVTEHMTPQFKDLVTRYKPSIIFSDGEWDLSDTAWQSESLLAWLFNESPVKNDVVVNDRWGSKTRSLHPCTYYTSEYGSGMDKSVVWEENRGMGQSFGYNRMEKLADYKTSQELILMLVDIVSRGGNLLLDIGPAADGTIPVIMEDRLSNIGKWLEINGEAIYGTTPWKQDKQWSRGIKPRIGGGRFMANYDINQLVIPNNKQAFVELFFTSKGPAIYGIVPFYSPKILIKDIEAGSRMQVSILGLQKPVKWKATKNGIELDISSLKPSDLPNQAFVVKIANSKN
jgi:alpha-L-fucosidase